ncbi:MAG: S41 family peptidase [bacterium]
MFSKFSFLKTVFILLLAVSFITCAQENKNITKEEREAFVENVSKQLNDNYVFAEVAAQIEKHLKAKLAAGAFDNITDATEFADLMTNEVQSISNDRHMRVRVRPTQLSAPAERPNPIIQNYETKKMLENINYGFRKVEKLEGNIGYLDLTGFPPLALAKDYADRAMNLLSGSDALIIDLRHNGGGNPDLIQYVSSYLFEKSTHINSLYYRRTNQTIDYITFEKVDGKKMADVPLFLLTSNYTFSGGEEFAYNIQTQKRGTLIGETTGGGANPGGMVPITGTFAVFIPTGRAINPITKTNWEGVGVVPEIKCTADEALDTALLLARDAAKTRNEAKDKLVKQHAAELESNIAKAERLFDEKKTMEAEKFLITALENALTKELIDEVMINQFGYEKIGAGKIEMAISLLKYNVKAFPESANVYDSLGEAYMTAGDNTNAILNYKKSLELNLQNTNAVEVLKRLGVE